MAGTDDLFPDAREVDGVELPTAPTEDRQRSPRLGLVAFFCGMVATVGNISGIIAAVAVIAAIASQFGDPVPGENAPVQHLEWVIPFEIAVLVGGVVLGIAAIVLGIRAARQRRGRPLGVLGTVLGGLAVLTDLVVGVLAALFLVAPA